MDLTGVFAFGAGACAFGDGVSGFEGATTGSGASARGGAMAFGGGGTTGGCFGGGAGAFGTSAGIGIGGSVRASCGEIMRIDGVVGPSSGMRVSGFERPVVAAQAGRVAS